MISNLILDLDGTLYNNNETNIPKYFDHNATTYVAELMNYDFSTSAKLIQSYLQQYGSTIQGLIQSKAEFCAERFLEHLHDIDISEITHNDKLHAILTELPYKTFIYTNGCCHYAKNVINKLGISELIDGIFDIRMSNYISKPASASFEMFFAHFNLDPASCLFVDDSKANLETGKQMGMATCYVDHNANYNDENYIDHATVDLVELLTRLPQIESK